MRPLISIVIVSHRPQSVRLTIESLIPPAGITARNEIIVVADYPIEEFQTHNSQCIWLYCNDRSIPRKRNIGAAYASAEYIGFIDDDCIAAFGWASEAITFLDSHPEYIGVQGRTQVGTAGSAHNAAEFKRLESPGLRTNNIVFRRLAFDAAEFDERFTFQHEDVDFCLTLMAKGHAIGSDTEMIVIHALRPGEPWDLIKNCLNRRFDPLLFKKHKIQYRRFVRKPVPPTIALIALSHLFLLCTIPVNPLIAMPGIGLDILLCIVAAVRRVGGKGLLLTEYIRQTLLYAVSPFVLFCSLLWGNIKHRTFLFY